MVDSALARNPYPSRANAPPEDPEVEAARQRRAAVLEEDRAVLRIETFLQLIEPYYQDWKAQAPR